FMLWYPIKTREGSGALSRRLGRLGIAKILRSELIVGPLREDAGLSGSGLIVVNPPFTLEQDLRILLPTLSLILARGADPAGQRIDWLSP
ncbi:MAG: 23S rRNA (adenine(2030)-N(6))-methyltransferase RlmJ, partial [Xanthobacteraceae bacterium]